MWNQWGALYHTPSMAANENIRKPIRSKWFNRHHRPADASKTIKWYGAIIIPTEVPKQSPATYVTKILHINTGTTTVKDVSVTSARSVANLEFADLL